MSANPVPTSSLVLAALSEELARALGSLVGADAAIAQVPAPVEPEFVVTVRVGAPVGSVFTIGFSKDDATHVARVASGAADEPSDRAVLDIVHELVGQAVEALRLTPVGAEILFCVESPEARPPAPAGQGVTFEVSLFGDLAPRLGIWVARDVEASANGPAAETASTGATIGESPAPPAWTPPAAAAGTTPLNLDVILDIDLPLSVRFGQTEMTLNAITRLGPGSVIDLGRSPDDPVEVLVNGRLVARGEVVVVSGSYGVRILEVVSTADRVRSLGN
jgi:flagellar motor switch protein FliN